MGRAKYSIISCYISILCAVIFLARDISAENCLDKVVLNNTRNMIVNSGFEDTPYFAGWSLSTNPSGVTTVIDYTNSNNGVNSIKVTWDGSSENQNYFHTYQTVDVTPGRTYRVIGSIKTEDVHCDNYDYASWNGIRILMFDPDYPYGSSGYWSVTTESLYDTNDWRDVLTEFTVPSYSSKVRLLLRRFVGSYSGPSYGSAWWDDVQLLPVPVIHDLSFTEYETTINGESFGVDPGAGNRSGEENCLLYDGVCVPDSAVKSWSNNMIVINNLGEGVLNVRSGGIVSNAMIEQPDLTLSNNTVSIYFPNIINGDGIGEITDADTGRQFIDDSIAVKPLYELTVKDDPLSNVKTIINSREASIITKSYSEENGQKILTITANHCNEFTVSATIVLPSDHGAARFSIDIQNNGNRVLQSVRYPLIAAKHMLGSSSVDDAIIIPYFEGYLIKDPGSLTTSYAEDKEYPGDMTLQMLAYYDKEQPGAGLYLSSNDNAGYKKRFGFERVNKDGDNYILFSFLHITSEEHGNDLSVPYEVLIDTFSGDWYNAADKYKQWALMQPWTSKKLTERDDVPAFLFDIKTMIDCYDCLQQNYVTLVNHYENLLDVQNILLYPGGFWGLKDGFKEGFYYTDKYINQQPVSISWSGIDYFSNNPVYNPNEAYNPPFNVLKTAIDNLRAQGSDILLFIEGTPLWDQYIYKMDSSNPEFKGCDLLDRETDIPEELRVLDDIDDFYAHAFPYLIIREDGSGAHRFNFAIPADMADEYCRVTSTICVGSDGDNIMDIAIYNAIKRGIDHGARLMSLDGLISGKIDGCWDPIHGHPIGEGRWTHERYMSMLDDIKNILMSKNAYGNFGLSMEDPHELYLQNLQMQYLRHSELSSAGNKKIPLFNYIYKDYYIGIERGMSLGGSNDLDKRWSLAMDFIQGNIQGTMVPSVIVDLDDDLIDYYKRLIKMKHPDFYKGSMLHPPDFIDMPVETTISRNGRSYYIDPIVSNVLKTDDRTVSYLFVNSNLDGSGMNGIQFVAEQYDLPAETANIKIIKNSELIYNHQDALNTVVKVELDGGDVVEVRVKSGCTDSDGDYYFAEGGECGALDCDDDGDGYLSSSTLCGGTDWDDADDSVYPGAPEICDGKDNDGDGIIDEGFDNDNDGYTSCSGDCNDNNSAVKPDAVEILNDGLDNNCDGIAAVSGSSGWYDDPGLQTDWLYRQSVTIEAGMATTDLPGFPVLIKISDPNNPVFTYAQSDYDDIVFADSSGNKLPHEIEKFSPSTGELVAWVKMPTLSSADATIYMYYGNNTAQDQQNKTGVWDENYVMVQHLSEMPVNGQPSQHLDSTSKNNHSNFVNVAAQGAAGKIGGADEFNGVNNYVIVPDSDSLDVLGELTIEAWINPKTWTTSVMGGIVNKLSGGTVRSGYRFHIDANGNCIEGADPTLASFYGPLGWKCSEDLLNIMTLNAWHHVVVTYGSNSIDYFVDNVHAGAIPLDSPPVNSANTLALVIGAWNITGGVSFDGFIDEVRISNIARTAEWIAAEYNNQNDPGSYISFATSEIRCTDADGDGYAVEGDECGDKDWNDWDDTVYPGANEICDGKDNDGDGAIDEGVLKTYYLDADGDGYGNQAVTTQACTAPAGYITEHTDCNDINATAYPGAPEIPNDGIDQDCNGEDLDTLPPDITITTPVDGSVYLLNQEVVANWVVTDSGSGVASSTGTASPASLISTSIVGNHGFTVSASDNAGNSASQSVTYFVNYSSPNPDFFLPPLENNRVYKLNSTIPIKFQLKDAAGNYVSTATAYLTLLQYSDNEPIGNPIDVTPTDNPDMGNLFRYDSAGNQYIYNLKTTDWNLSIGTWQIKVGLNDGTIKTIFIGLK